MNLIEVTKKFQTQESCLDYLAVLRWPNDMECMKCGVVASKDNFRKFKTKETTRKRYSKKKQQVVDVKVPSRSLYECKGCGYQFSATTGTVFHDSHLPLEKWFHAVAMILEAKKGMSALQVCRHLGVPEELYKSIWYLCHRIREATKETGLLSGEVEADETYMTRRKPRKGKPYVQKEGKDVVLGMVERGGNLRLIPVKDAKMEIIGPVLTQHVSPDVQTIYTDDAATYAIYLGRNFEGKHKIINHSRTYAIGQTHTQHIENAFSLLKRGIYGTFHHVSIKHLPRYCNEFSYRFNRRGSQSQMFEETMKGLLRGEPLPYKVLTASERAEL
jgi:transposase-like protein